jgi:hypothetical protein
VIKFIIIGLCLPFSIYPSCFFLSVCASFSLSALRYLCLDFSMSVHQFLGQPVHCHSVCPSICLSVLSSVWLPACLHICLFLCQLSQFKKSIFRKKKVVFLFSQNEGIGHISNTDLCGFMQTDRRTDRQTGAN